MATVAKSVIISKKNENEIYKIDNLACAWGWPWMRPGMRAEYKSLFILTPKIEYNNEHDQQTSHYYLSKYTVK